MAGGWIKAKFPSTFVTVGRRVRTRWLLVPLLSILMLMTVPAEARFLHEDASEIDREERLSSETYNDEISYRYPRRWQETWAQSTLGYRVSAGSYNVSRFMFLEDIKVTTDFERPVSFGFRQTRDEDMIEQRVESELRVSVNHAPMRFAILGDGGTFKQYGDLGFALTFLPTEQFSIELQYWSVDHYYNSRKEFPIDTYRQRPQSYVLHLHWQLPGAMRLEYSLNLDLHTRWARLSQDYTYDYRRTIHEWAIRVGEQRGWSFNLEANFATKLEKKEYQLAVGNYYKSLDRRIYVVEANTVYSPTVDQDTTIGIMQIIRDAAYAYGQDAAVTAEMIVEPYSPTATRREMAYYATHYRPLAGATYIQYGLFINNVQRTEVGSDDRSDNEVKLQLAWDFQFDKYASVFLNTTWDLDQLQQDFPFKHTPFKPWGGGNIQFIAVF